MAPQLAWIGLGNMGRGMCKNLVEKGNLDKPLILFNRTTSRSEDLASRLGSSKTKVVNTINDAVKSSDIVFMCLGDDAAVNAAVDKMLEEDVKGKLIVDCSTVHPETTNALEKKINEKGGEFVGMPVFGAPAMADNGQLVCVTAGSKAACDKVVPYTTGVMGRTNIDYSGQPAGNATLMKVIGNTFILNMVSQLSEGHVLAEKSGLGVNNLHTFISTMFPGPYTAYSQRMLAGDYYQREEPLFHIDLARKDARHAMSLAESSGAKESMKMLGLAQGRLDSVKSEIGDRGDIPSVYGVVRKESGLGFKNKD
ncbi:NAD binding domain of 6-phosphogluconate dehydrogenase-domain-containing protein [Alternaria rosae]|uniref:NAD binding domain of 6-phosphogluconate dehydrogenase-domain-containing protein n=1 Tax=Alternaria rosae TaxID=1187941 RepID=UPI001E8DABB7|nr:NAD binding domain of 6-phosphogluconate dehydrogenase-domain-containing protein [Alternaria rosae]KAH6872508.1 NAD binding domain of 6-phosphogluconate dehydrogenase-domain-containing protein [Alternaria rosae]